MTCSRAARVAGSSPRTSRVFATYAVGRTAGWPLTWYAVSGSSTLTLRNSCSSSCRNEGLGLRVLSARALRLLRRVVVASIGVLLHGVHLSCPVRVTSCPPLPPAPASLCRARRSRHRCATRVRTVRPRLPLTRPDRLRCVQQMCDASPVPPPQRERVQPPGCPRASRFAAHTGEEDIGPDLIHLGGKLSRRDPCIRRAPPDLFGCMTSRHLEEIDKAVHLARRAAVSGRLREPEALTRFLYRRWWLGRPPVQSLHRRSARRTPSAATSERRLQRRGGSGVRGGRRTAPARDRAWCGSTSPAPRTPACMPWRPSRRSARVVGRTRGCSPRAHSARPCPAPTRRCSTSRRTRWTTCTTRWSGWSTRSARSSPRRSRCSRCGSRAVWRLPRTRTTERRSASTGAGSSPRSVLDNLHVHHREVVDRTYSAFVDQRVDPRRPYRELDADWEWDRARHERPERGLTGPRVQGRPYA